MSPFSAALRQLRIEHGISQGALARQLGIRQARLSALECGTKQPTDGQTLILGIVSALQLSEAQAGSLQAALDASNRLYEIPAEAPPAAYVYCTRLFEALPALTPAHFTVLTSMLDLVQIKARFVDAN
jgi:transcriptional regulator with XRE-family HTH domain